MVEGLPPSYIRDEFVVAFIRRRDAAWAKRWSLIADRDDKGREINRAFGLTEPDGSTSPYLRSNLPDYKARFAAVETEFQPRYDAVSANEMKANRADGMTVWEYLLLEEIQNKELYLRAAASGNYVDWIALKASDEIEVRDRTLGEIQRLLQIKKGHFRYAAARCRSVLEIGPLDVGAQVAILRFKAQFDREKQRYLASARLK